MEHEHLMGVLITLPLLLQLAGLIFAVLADSYIRRRDRRIMLIIVAVVSSLIVQNLAGYQLDAIGTMPYERTLVGIYGYCVRPLTILFFCDIVSKTRERPAAWILIGINTAVHLTALFSGICFSIDANDKFHRGPLGYTCHIISGVLLFYLLYLTIREYSGARKLEIWIPVFNVLIISVSVVMDSASDYRAFPVSYLTIAVVSSCVFYYIWLHLQFVREHEQNLLAEQRIQIMMSQIQPHFLYNTLSTIQALCRTDPEKAFDTTEKFGTYLRQNIASLDQPELIPIEKELEHTRIYAEIEMIRFPNVHVRYDMGDTDFSLPALSVQPLVENAIRHGVRIRKEGLVSVITRKESRYHEIIVRDNGKGFDVKDQACQDSAHIGIRNVRERIEQMCGGTLSIESRIGEGSVATIRIPYGGGRG